MIEQAENAVQTTGRGKDKYIYKDNNKDKYRKNAEDFDKWLR